MFLSYLVREIRSCYDLFENQIFLYNESCPQSIQQESDREEDLEVGAILWCCIKGTLFKSSGTNATSHISFSLSFEVHQFYKTLPEAQRTQGIESITQIITHGKNYL